MNIDKEKLRAALMELIQDMDNVDETAVCICEGESNTGTAFEIHLTATTQEHDFFEGNDNPYMCVEL